MTRLPTPPPVVRDVGLLVARLAIGVAFAAHGWQKLTDGLDATSGGMAQAGVPFPRASALFATAVELGAGVLLAAGALTALAGVLLSLVMAGAFTFVHAGSGPFVDEGGWELVVALGASCLFIAAAGAGRVSVDHGVARLRGREVVLGEPAGSPREVDVRQERTTSRR